jgi:hypothetical protein
MDKIKPYRDQTPGLPQGAPISPILTILPLNEIIDEDTIMYADDGIKFPAKGTSIELDSRFEDYTGISYNEEKSG